MVPSNFDLYHTRGDYESFSITFPDASYLSGKTVLAQVRDDDDELVGTFDAAVNGAVLTLAWTPECAGDFRYDVQVGTSTYVAGYVYVTNDVSRSDD